MAKRWSMEHLEQEGGFNLTSEDRPDDCPLGDALETNVRRVARRLRRYGVTLAILRRRTFQVARSYWRMSDGWLAAWKAKGRRWEREGIPAAEVAWWAAWVIVSNTITDDVVFEAVPDHLRDVVFPHWQSFRDLLEDLLDDSGDADR